MKAEERTGFAALAALVLTAGCLLAPTAASAATVSTTIGGVTYEADDADIAAGAAAIEFDFSTPSVAIPDAVEIGGTDYAVTQIGDEAFYDDSDPQTPGVLADVAIGDNVTRIGDRAFRFNQISQLTLGASVEVVGHAAFSLNDLTQVVFPASVTSLGGGAFSSNEQLQSAEFSGPAPSIDANDEGAPVWRGSFNFASDDFVISFPEQYGEPVTSGGYTTPEWEGYPTQMIAADRVSIAKTVEASYVRVHDWTLEKSGAVDEITVTDDTASADVDYTVTAIPDGFTDSYHVLSGEITVTNEFVEPVSVAVTDTPSVGIDATCRVVTATGALADDVQLVGEASVVLDYRCSFSEIPSDGSNTATATWNGGEVSATADVAFTERSTNFETVTIVDDQGDPGSGHVELGQATWGNDGLWTVFTYTLTEDDLPVGECTSVTNTAWIAERELPTEATVEICPEAAAIPSPDEPVEPAAPEDPQSGATRLPATGSGLDAGFAVMAATMLLVGGGVVLTLHGRRRRL